MAASVLNTLAVSQPASSPLLPPRAPESTTDFASQLDRAHENSKTGDAKANQKSQGKESTAAPKPAREAAGQVKGAKKNKTDAIDEDSSAKPTPDATTETAINGVNSTNADESSSGSESKGSAKGKAQSKIIADTGSVELATAGVANGNATAPAATVELKGTSDPAVKATSVAKVTALSPTDAPEAVPGATGATTTDAEKVGAQANSAKSAAKANETAAAFESKTGATATTRDRKAPVIPVSDELPATPTAAPAGKSQAIPTAVSSDAIAVDAKAPNDPGNLEAIDLNKHSGSSDDASSVGQTLVTQSASPHTTAINHPHTGTVSTPEPLPPEARFAEVNHPAIVSEVRSRLLPHGGSMELRLDPPELGALQVSLEMHNGAMTATFQTSNEDATRLLSHSLGQLKSALEAQGISVEKIQVQQSPKNQSSQGQADQSPQQQRDEANARQQQQRKEMLNQMWRRISGVPDPVDLVA